MKILSFIIPSYNCEKFLEKCVSSMLHPEILEQLEADAEEEVTANG